MSRLKLGAIVALIAGPLFIVMNYLETNEKKQIAREGVETVAIPTTKIERRRKGGRTYKLEIQYPIQGGQTHTATVKVSHELYDKVDSEPILRIRYLKTDPTKLIVVGEPLDSPEMYFAGIAAFLFGIGGTWWCFFRRIPEATSTEPTSALGRPPHSTDSHFRAEPPSLPSEPTASPSPPDDDERFKPPGERKGRSTNA